MINTDAYEEMTWETPSDELEDAVEHLLAEVKRLSALADALFDLIPSHPSTEATDVWNKHMGPFFWIGDEEE